MIQVVAWSQMLANYSSEEGIVKGVKMTFDGNHPCALCKVAAKSRKQNPNGGPYNNPSSSGKLLVKNVLLSKGTDLPEPVMTDFRVTGFPPIRRFVSVWESRPPVPPPRLIRARANDFC